MKKSMKLIFSFSDFNLCFARNFRPHGEDSGGSKKPWYPQMGIIPLYSNQKRIFHFIIIRIKFDVDCLTIQPALRVVRKGLFV